MTRTWRRQMSCGPHSSMRWQVRQPCGCSESNSSKTLSRSPRISVPTEFTTMPFATGSVQDAGVPRPPSTSTQHIRHAP